MPLKGEMSKEKSRFWIDPSQDIFPIVYKVKFYLSLKGNNLPMYITSVIFRKADFFQRSVKTQYSEMIFIANSMVTAD